MILALEILIVILFIAFLFFVGLFIYGYIKDKKLNRCFATSKQVWVGLIGLNICNLLVQITDLILKGLN